MPEDNGEGGFWFFEWFLDWEGEDGESEEEGCKEVHCVVDGDDCVEAVIRGVLGDCEVREI